jgi:protein ImuA
VKHFYQPSVPPSTDRSSLPDDSLPARQEVIETLRAYIGRIEGSAVFTPASLEASSWTLGVPAIDELMGPDGIDIAGVHEIRFDTSQDLYGAAAATAARRVFALLLGVRRLAALKRAGPILWTLPLNEVHEAGALYSHGLRALGLDPDRLIIVTPRKSRDVLWILEEALRSGAVSMVVGEVAAASMTASRRLSLAAAEAGCPCVLVSPPGSIPAAAVATRWRVAPRSSGDDPLDAAAPGARCFAIALERCRSRPIVSENADFVVEWLDGARSFRMVAAVSDRAVTPVSQKSRAWQESVQRRIA